MSNTPKSASTGKDKKPKLVRDSFTIPKAEYAAIDALKARAMALGVGVKKSELLRAGLMALATMSDAALGKALAAVPTLKTGRPAKEEKRPRPASKSAAQPAPKPLIQPVATPAVKPVPRPAPQAPAKTARKTAAAKKAPARAKKSA